MNTDEVRAKFENDCLPEWLSYSGATNCYHLKEEFRGGLWYGRRDEYNDKWEGYQQGIKDSEGLPEIGDYPYQKTDEYRDHVKEIERLKKVIDLGFDALDDYESTAGGSPEAYNKFIGSRKKFMEFVKALKEAN